MTVHVSQNSKLSNFVNFRPLKVLFLNLAFLHDMNNFII